MSADYQDEGVDPEKVLNAVGDPEAFIEELRDAHRDRQLRRGMFIDSLSPEVKAEWIDGEAVYHSPAREAHNATVTGLSTMLNIYSTYKTELYVRIEKAMTEVGSHNFEPDICVFLASKHDFDAELMIYPVPDLAVEVLSKRTAQRDLGTKKDEYAKGGTQEYLVIDAREHTVTQFVQAGGHFVERGVLTEGDTLHSTLLPDLALPLRAIWDRLALAEYTRDLVVGA